MKQRIRVLLVCILLSTSFTPTVSASNSDGIISNVIVDKSTVNAGDSVTVSFNVLLSQAPPSPFSYGAYVYGTTEEYGDSWSDQQWYAQATLVSGTQVNGRWSATINIGAGAYTGSYVAAISVPSKSFTRAASVPITISGTTPPIPLPPISETISNFVADKSTVNAGGSVTLTFDIALSATPPSPFSYGAYIYGMTDENGDSWTDQQWYAQATLVSGTQVNGRWSATVNIGAGAYTGSYVARLALNRKINSFTGSASVPITISGTTPPIPLPPISETISNFVADKSTVSAGGSITFTFDRALSATPPSPFEPWMYIFISELSDENLEPWREEQWHAQATLVSGTQVNGRWSATVNIGAGAYTGSYVARLLSKSKFFNTNSASVPISISGTTPPIRINPTYVFSNQVLSTPAIVRGSSAEATFHLTSNDSQLQTPECIIDGGVGSWSDATLVLGQKLDGNWKCSVTVPSNTAPGTYDFHIVVIGRANNEKNEERVVLPIKIVANGVDLLGPSSNNAFITTSDISSTSEINADSVGGPLSHVAFSAAVARVFISQGSGTVTASVNGPGLIGFNSGSPLGRAISINRSSNSVTNLYVFADGTQGRSTISIMVSGQASTKVINFGNLGGLAPTSTPSPTPTPTPMVKPSPTPTPTVSESPETKESPTPKPSTVSPTPKPSTVSPTPKPSTVSPTPVPKKTSTPKPITLICIKEKITKTITALKPVCPAGYKAKK